MSLTPMKVNSVKILDAVTSTGAGARHHPWNEKRTFQLTGQVSAGAGSADVDVQGSNDGINWTTIATISLSLSTVTSNDGFASDAPWRYVRGNVTTITGTDATVTLWMGA